MKEFRKSVNNSRNYRHEFGVLHLLRHSVFLAFCALKLIYRFYLPASVSTMQLVSLKVVNVIYTPCVNWLKSDTAFYVHHESYHIQNWYGFYASVGRYSTSLVADESLTLYSRVARTVTISVFCDINKQI